MKRVALVLVWLALAIVAAVLYGVFNDQITCTISPEYFSVFKHRQFAAALSQWQLINASVRVQTCVVATLSTWWYGLFLGIVLSISGNVGRGAAISTKRYLSALAHVLALTLAASVIAGSVATLVKPDPLHWPFLRGIHHLRRAFIVGCWHNGAYAGALLATVIESLRVQYERRRQVYMSH